MTTSSPRFRSSLQHTGLELEVQAQVLEVFEALSSSTALNRSRGLTKLQQALSHPGAERGVLAEGLQTLAAQSWTDQPWEQRYAALCVAQELISSRQAGTMFANTALGMCQKLLEDPEPRVRLAVGTCLAVMAEARGAGVWESTGRRITGSIRNHWDRDALLSQRQPASAATATLTAAAAAAAQQLVAVPGNASAEHPDTGQQQTPKLIQSLLSTSYAIQHPGSGELRHGTEGWQCLETSFQALRLLLETLQGSFQPYATHELQLLVLDALLHPNRYVRETAWHAVAALCTHVIDLSAGHRQVPGQPGDAAAAAAANAGNSETQQSAGSNGDSRERAGAAMRGVDFGSRVAERLQDGLSENWSQVRYAACVAARAFCLAAGQRAQQYYPIILPHLCFNRHDVAEGVRSYSLDTWRLVMGDSGPLWVARCLPQVVQYYERCARTNNHTTREAACACWGELGTKIEAAAVQPHVPRILCALTASLKDDTWNVRGAACIASGQVARAFPAESAAFVDSIFPLWVGNLDDNVFSVRQDAAAAIGDFASAHGEAAWERVLPVLGQMLPRALEEPPAAEALEEDRSQPGSEAQQDMFRDNGLLMRKIKDTGGVDYSCGCMDYGFRRPKLPWEASDGAIYLLAHLAALRPEPVVKQLDLLAQLARAQHFPQWRQLQETLWTQLPPIARGIGKKAFKPHLEPFMEPMFRALRSEHQLCRAAAGVCVGSMRDMLGPNIFAGRLDDAQRAMLASSPDVPPPAGNLTIAGSGLLGRTAPAPFLQPQQATAERQSACRQP